MTLPVHARNVDDDADRFTNEALDGVEGQAEAGLQDARGRRESDLGFEQR
jgi:hypothetical protein